LINGGGNSAPVFVDKQTKEVIMADVSATVQNVVKGLVSLIKGLVVLFVFANIIYATGFDPVGGIVDLVNAFLDGGFPGLLALLFFISFLD